MGSPERLPVNRFALEESKKVDQTMCEGNQTNMSNLNLAQLLPDQSKNLCMSMRKTTLCSSHSHELLFFCDTCNVVLCAECLLSHRVHDVTKLDRTVLRGKATDMVASLSMLSEATRDNIHSTADTLKETEMAHARSLKNLEDNFRLLEDKVRQLKDEAVKSFCNTRDKSEVSLKHRMFSLESFNRDVYALKARTEQLTVTDQEDPILAKNIQNI